MELIETVLCYCFGLTNIFLILYLMIYLSQKRNSYPYSKSSPLCGLLFIACIFLHQFLYFIMSWAVYRDDLNLQKLLKTINSINTHCLFIIPIVFRMNILHNLTKYNFYHLTYQSQSPKFSQIDSDIYFNTRLNHPNQDLIAFLYGGLCFITANIFLSFLLSYKITRCFLYNSSSFSTDIFTDIECNPGYRYQHVLYNLLKNGAFFGELFYFLNKLCSLWKYPIQKDLIYVRFEMLINFTWFYFHNIYHWYAQFDGKISFFGMFLFNDVIDFTFVILHLFLVQIRKNLRYKTKSKAQYLVPNKPPYVMIINKFSKFMRNYFCFTYFKKYILETSKDRKILHLLDFWVDYYLYKLHLKKPNILKKTDLIIHAYYLYCNYFKRDKINESSYNCLDIPIDHLDLIEKASQKGFCMARTELDKIYDEAFGYINNKLYNIYCNMLSSKSEQRQLTSIFLHTEFDEVKEGVINESESYV